jgi:hypothetical protein
MNSKAFTVVSICLIAFAAQPRKVSAQFFSYATADNRGTLHWVPPGLQTVKGIVVWGNGAGADERAAAQAPWIQQFAQLHDFALIGTSMWSNFTGGEISIWDQHIANLAAQSGHPELKNAPLAPIGFSNGGQMSYGFNALRPEKTIAFVTNKGCCYNNTLPSTAALNTPGILIAGELDTDVRLNSIHSLFDSNRARGALWSWVEQQGVAHAGLAMELMIPFVDEAIRLRYPANQVPTATTGVTLLNVNPTSGWLTDQSTWKSGLTKINSSSDYPGNKQTAGWLLNDNVAYEYRAFSTYNHEVNLSFVNSNVPELPEVNYGFNPTGLQLQLDLSGTPGWTNIELFNGAQPLLQVLPAAGQPSIVTLNAPILKSGVYGLSALVTKADGHTLSTSNLLLFTAIPEPATAAMLFIGCSIVVVHSRLRRRESSRLHNASALQSEQRSAYETDMPGLPWPLKIFDFELIATVNSCPVS